MKSNLSKKREMFMTDDKKYLDWIITILILFFTTYAVMKDLIANPESTKNAFFLAVVFDVLFCCVICTGSEVEET